jgi:hypothetical protein
MAAQPAFGSEGNSDMTDNARDEMPRKQPQDPQPSLSPPDAAPDSNRDKKPPLGKRTSTDKKLVPGDRVEANFGKPSGVVGTVEQANEEDVGSTAVHALSANHGA